MMDNIFFVPEEARWNIISANAHSPEIGIVIDKAMRAIEAENKTLKGVLPKNFANPELDKRVLGEVVDIFTNIDMGDIEESKDLLGRTYEYCIAQFASHEGRGGGEFYTPACVVKTIVEVLKPFDNCRVYDPCCGSGGMFVQSAKFIEAHSGKRGSISVYGQEANPDTWKLAKMNMAIRGIDADLGPNHGDTFFNDLHRNMRADFIMANPPFNLSNWGQEKLTDDVRWKYGTPPAGNANYAWIQHMIHHLAPNGKFGMVLANGALSTQTGGEGVIRKNIIEADLVEAIVAMPANLFYSVTIPVTLWFISKNKKQKGKTVFIDARKMGTMIDRMCRLYEKFILEYYRKEHPEIKASASQIPWQLDDNFSSMLPVMQTDIMLSKGNTVLIIDAKYYGHTIQSQYGVHSLHSGNLYQVFTYVKNKDAEFSDEPHVVSGMLLYAHTDEMVQPNHVYHMSGNQITVRTLNLNLPFKKIAAQLDEIVESHFSNA